MSRAIAVVVIGSCLLLAGRVSLINNVTKFNIN